MTLKTDIDQIAVDAPLLHTWVHGGPAESITTDGGPVKTLAKTVADAETQIASVSDALLAIDLTVFPATLVDAFIYDTSKDYKGGEWRLRCDHTSWMQETLSGNWLRYAANETAARAIDGATTGSYYYDTTALGFYTLDSGSGKTATYRGNVAQFPAKVLITVEADRVIIWDLTQAGCPMWMVFVVAGSWNAAVLLSVNGLSSVDMVNGCMAVGETSNSCGLMNISFVSDAAFALTNNTLYGGQDTAGLALRNSSGHTFSAGSGSELTLINNIVNDVAITVLPDAPIDQATGLPVPTIAVATAGGVSVIKDDGTVVNSSSTASFTKVSFCGESSLSLATPGGSALYYVPTIVGLAAGWAVSNYSNATIPAASPSAQYMTQLANSKYSERIYAIGSIALGLLKENPATPAEGMVAYLTKDYNSGWMPGDIRGAWLADTTAETLVGTELVTNGDFASDVSGWTGNGATVAFASGAMRVTNTAAAYGYASQAFTTVVGKTYTVGVEGKGGTSSALNVTANNASGGTLLGQTTNVAVTGMYTFSFVAAQISTTLNCYLSNVSGQYVDFDNITCRLAVPDRSVKADGLQVFGSITKAAVASGAQLVGYSGFSAANYLEQPYNSDLDFGTGDFWIAGWAEISSFAAVSAFLHRGQAASDGGIDIRINTGAQIEVYLSASTSYAFVLGSPTNVVVADQRFFIEVFRKDGTLYIGVNVADVASVANATNITYSGAVTRIGVTLNGTQPLLGEMSLWRASATVPSAEQRRHIYETEKKLFEANAQCCLAGTSSAVTALAYDDETDLLHVGTSYGRSTFHGLTRVDSEATAVGAITALSASGGVIAQGGATGADVYVPAYNLREELNRDAEQMAAFGQNLIAHEFDATAAQTTFTLPVGWEIVSVYAASGAGSATLQREGSGKQWTRSFDGFKWSAVFASGRSASDWVSILAKRT